jgi:transcriptional coactivator HFI1/ADA1
VESGEFPDTSSIEAKMLPSCYEAGLVQGHASDAAQLLSIATETFMKEFLSTVFRRTRSNGPGDSGSAGFGAGSAWIQTHKYRRQLRREEAAFAKGDITRDKSGLLPIEAKEASERRPLDIADLRLALDLGDCGMSYFPSVTKSIIYNYREGELEHWGDHTFIDGHEPAIPDEVKQEKINGHADPMEVDGDDYGGWEGAETMDMQALDNILESCLAGP